MEPGLLAEPKLEVPDEVRGTLEKWQSMAGPHLQDFGFVALDGPKVVAWATVDAIVDGVGDAGLVTLPAYRQRGLATAVSGAAVAHGLSQGLSAIHWTCAEHNAGSIRIAEKLGFERQADYGLYYFVFDEGQHLAARAYAFLESSEYEQAAEVYEQLLALADEYPAWVYHDAARTWAALGDRERAFALLNKALDGGLVEIEGVLEFETLHAAPQWADVLRRAQQF
jgi:RimJ/RimL family protein N-acetyltransferase